MHAISSASPSHVLVRGLDRYDVVCWTVSPDGLPFPWFVIDGVITLYDMRAGHRLLDGTAADGYDA